jgi:replicative DNA helicase
VISGWLCPQDSARPLCGELYELIGGMRAAGQHVDPVTVLGGLRRRGRVRSDGYAAMELIAMIESVPAPLMTPHYARQVLEAAVYRQVQLIGGNMAQVGRLRRGSPDDSFDSVTTCWAELVDVRERWSDAPATPP